MGEPASAISLFNPFIPIRDDRSAMKAARLGAIALWAVAIFNLVQAAILFQRTGNDGVYETLIAMIVLTAGVMHWFRPSVRIAGMAAGYGFVFLTLELVALAGFEQPLTPALVINTGMAVVTLILGVVSWRGADWLKRAARIVPAT